MHPMHTSRLAVLRSLWMMAGRCACRQLMPRAMSMPNSTFFTRSRCRPDLCNKWSCEQMRCACDGYENFANKKG